MNGGDRIVIQRSDGQGGSRDAMRSILGEDLGQQKGKLRSRNSRITDLERGKMDLLESG